ncbi:hypothetical protein HYZ99_02755 [Candidatus Peregrinibacteria bacterium]|nr:hypothetical protein [Candidatus Peregrinibacteria bacterium]
MKFSRVIQQSTVVIYLAITVSAFLYTMVRVTPPIPRLLLFWSYGMMAPYQGDTWFNDDLRAEGQLPDGSFELISLDPYIPTGFGERNVRKHLKTFQPDHDTYRRKFTAFARALLERERARGKLYDAVRLTWLSWPRSPEGYDALKHPPFLTEEFITQVTWQ